MTFFEKEELPKNEEMIVKRIATQVEMINIKNTLKIKVKDNKPRKTKDEYIFKQYKPGYIMMDIETMDRYIIIERKNN